MHYARCHSFCYLIDNDSVITYLTPDVSVLTIPGNSATVHTPNVRKHVSHTHTHYEKKEVCCLLVGCLTSQQHASVSQGRICSDNFTCCHTEIQVADQTFHLTQSQYTDTGPTSPSADTITLGAWQGSHWSANSLVTGMTRPRKKPGASRVRTWDLPLSRRTPYH